MSLGLAGQILRFARVLTTIFNALLTMVDDCLTTLARGSMFDFGPDFLSCISQKTMTITLYPVANDNTTAGLALYLPVDLHICLFLFSGEIRGGDLGWISAEAHRNGWGNRLPFLSGL